MGKLLTEKEVSHEYGFPLGTLRKWRLYGSGPRYLKIGARCYYLHQDILAFIEASRRRSTSDGGAKENP